MRSWVPVPGTTTGRLVDAALELFGSAGFEAVAVGAIAERAGVTTGSLYHHFGSKEGLYRLVRADVEQRVVDRLGGAASMRPVRTIADLAPVLLVGFDYLHRSGYARLLGERAPDSIDHPREPDPIEQLIGQLVGTEAPFVGALIAAAWREALRHAGSGSKAARDARAALERLLSGR
jgi:AcrR family transcriptional regulator